MKKILLSLFVLALAGLGGKLQAQCTVSNLSVVNLTFDPNTCRLKFDVAFTQAVNSGNKFAYIHLWTTAKYHTPAANWLNSGGGSQTIYGGPSQAPIGADLINALATVQIIFNATLSPSIGTAYPANSNGGLQVTPLSAGLTITKELLPGGTTERETISGFDFILAGADCANFTGIRGDIWASQAAQGDQVHCVVQNLGFDLNPKITSAFKVCNSPQAPAGRRLNLAIQNVGTSAITVRYKIYRDNGNLAFNAANDALLFISPNIALNAGQTTSGISLSSADIASLGATGENSSYWVEVELVPYPGYSTVALMANSECFPLPVTFKSFSATRNRSNVMVKWETASETNNRGFVVERNINGSWEQVAFVPSQAATGNSDAALSYQFNDVNNTKGITQYRIKQIDLDAKSKYSEIKSVRGDGQMGKTIIYPNPSSDGKVNIVFEDANVSRDISVSDMSGRTVKQLKGVTNNNVTIDNLAPGIYSLRIVTPSTGDQTVEKIVVNKR